ncbi:MAG: hypothetical protein E4G96_00020 [Chrysiogenales bacterium]|nr:MAG: hypothetical protein E4G96_00020 [Chrysiogenales bacterium]
MEYMRVWTEVDIKAIEEHIIFVDDKYGHCPGCKKIGIELRDMKSCPSCGRVFRYVTSKEARGGKMDIVMRTKKKLPSLTFVDYNDYEHVLGKNKAAGLFNV